MNKSALNFTFLFGLALIVSFATMHLAEVSSELLALFLIGSGLVIVFFILSIRVSPEIIFKKLLFIFLFLLPFQALPKTFLGNQGKYSLILKAIRYSDEIVFLLSLFLLICFVLIRPAKYKIRKFPWNIPVCLFLLAAFFSLSIKNVPLLQGIFGTYDVIKNILVVYVFSVLCFSKEEFLKIINSLRKLALFLAGFGVIAEILALLFGLGIGYFVVEGKRLGFYRLISLVGIGSWNYFGIYLTLFLFLSFASYRKTKIFQKILFILAIIFTCSRQALLGAGVMTVFIKRKLLPLGILFLGLTVVLIIPVLSRLNPDYYLRSFVFLESLDILKENPVLGIGPGRFGGLASVLFKSPVYNDWPEFFKKIVFQIHGTDMFWPGIWGEFGLLGLFFYLTIWGALFFWLKKIVKFYKERKDKDLANIGKVLQYFIFALFIMGCAGGLNAAFVIFTYFALLGMYTSTYLQEINR